jgi:hypothetical protein
MPVRNAERYVASALDSILGQTFDDFEVIAVDDASDDRSAAIIESFADRRVRLLRNSSPMGVAGALNHALAHARGQLIARMDADDLCEPRRFELQVAYLEAHPEVGVLGTNCYFIDQDGNPTGVADVPTEPNDMHWELHFWCPLAHPSVMLRANVLRGAGGYATDAPHAEDYHLWSRLNGSVHIANLGTPLLRYRAHAGQVSGPSNSIQQQTSDWIRGLSLAKLLGAPVPPESLARWNQAVRGQLLDSEDALRDVADLIERALNAYLARWGLTGEAARPVVTRASQRMLAVAQLHAQEYPRAAQDMSARAVVLQSTPGIPDLFGPLAQPMRLDARRGVTFFHHPRWVSDSWQAVLTAYARSFSQQDDVTLVLWVDPAQGLGMDAVSGRLLGAMAAQGINPEQMPDLLLVPDRLDLAGLASLYAAVDWVVPHGDAIQEMRAVRSRARVLHDLEADSWRAARWTRPKSADHASVNDSSAFR